MIFLTISLHNKYYATKLFIGEGIVLYILCCSFLLFYLLYGSVLACFLTY